MSFTSRRTSPCPLFRCSTRKRTGVFIRMPESPEPSLTIMRDEGFDRALSEAPDAPAVFLIWGTEGAPYLAKTRALRRRLLRLLKEREKPSRLLNLRQTAA